MSTHQFMRSEYPAHGASAVAKPAKAPKRRYSLLEKVLMGAGFVAWVWCAYEIALLLIR